MYQVVFGESMKSLIATLIFMVLVIAWSWGMRIAYPPQPPQIGDTLETSILKAEKVYQETGIWELKGR